MKDGKCPQCQGQKVYWDTSFNGEALGIPVGFVKIIQTKRYICANCGFVAIYVANENDLQKIEGSIDLKKVN